MFRFDNRKLNLRRIAGDVFLTSIWALFALGVAYSTPSPAVEAETETPPAGKGHADVVAFFTDDPSRYPKSCDTATTDLAAFRKNATVKNLGCTEDD